MSIAVLGSINMDIVLTVPELPLPGETISASRRELFPGGKGANQAVASVRSGSDTLFIGAVGSDEYGKSLLAFLSDNQLDIGSVQILPGIETGRAYINVDASGENSIVVLSGANHAFQFKQAEMFVSKDLKVRLSQFEVPLSQIREFFADKSALRIINAAPAIKAGKDLFADADIIIVNEIELAAYSNEQFIADTIGSDIIFAARSLLSRADQWIVLTLGAVGSIAISTEDAIRVSGHKVNVVDTTGAGDCFCGALATALAEGQSIQQAMNFANAAASLAVTKNGAGPSMPTRTEIDAFLGDRAKTGQKIR